jgi:hypothetical protein
MGGSQASMTPSLPAAQPATFTVEGRTVRPLGDENDKAFALVNALDNTQRGQAILNYRVADLVLGPGQDGRTIQPEGLRASSMTPAQQAMLLGLIEEWAGIMTEAYAGPRMTEITRNLPQTWFAWSGPTTNGSAAYFRVQGPTIVIEYAPQGGVDHIHTIYRDPDQRLRSEACAPVRAPFSGSWSPCCPPREPACPHTGWTSISTRPAWRSIRRRATRAEFDAWHRCGRRAGPRDRYRRRRRALAG